MPRRYTDDEKRLVLDRLIANHGDIDLTILQTGLPERTIARWKQLALRNGTLMAVAMPPPLPPSMPQTTASLPSPVTMGYQQSELANVADVRPGLGVSSLPIETAEAFQILHDKLLTIISTLSNRIEEAIDEAPLNQRVTALSQLIDRIAKLAALLPAEEEEIEYVYEYEVEHHVEKNTEEQENREIEAED